MARTRTRFPTELLVEVRKDDPLPLHQQLEQELRGAIRGGRLVPETALPSTRVLAEQLSLSRGVVVEAYEQLVAEGYLTSLPGGATRVATRAAVVRPEAQAPTAAHEIRINFAYGRPDVTQFPRQVWLRSLRRVLVEAPSERLTYLDRRGAEELRAALAAYLNRVRGTAADAERIVICNGFAQAIDLVTQLVKARGGRRIAVEDPGDADGRVAVHRHGLETVPLPVDDGGISIEALRDSSADAVFLTPAHHYPTGAVMAPDRRAALLAWADGRDALILEDDYDAEYRYDREPIGAIHGLAPERVIYAGSASKTLAPGLRLGWMIVPHDHVDALGASRMPTIAAHRASTSSHSPISSSEVSSIAISAGCDRSIASVGTRCSMPCAGICLTCDRSAHLPACMSSRCCPPGSTRAGPSTTPPDPASR